MDITLTNAQTKNSLKWLAKAGLIAKGTVYILLSVLALMAALHVGGQSADESDKSTIFQWLNKSFAGKWLLPLLAIGLFCYSAWRCVEAIQVVRGQHKKYAKAIRYISSAIIYLLVGLSAVKLMLHKPVQKTDGQQDLASQLLSQPFGQWLVGVTAIIIAAVGVYQIYYGWSEKYKKYTQKINTQQHAASLLLAAGKAGYMARGVVWLIIAYLMLRAAFTGRSSNAGDTGKAFAFLESLPAGSLWLGAAAVGLLAYGVFALVRSRYEDFDKRQ